MRLKTCKVCPERFEPIRPMQVVCSPRCAIEHGRQKTVKNYLARNQPSKPKKTSPKESARKAICEFVRLRDEHKPCIVHGPACPNAGKGFHAGHFQSRGSTPELSFNLWNIHKQCGVSNSGAHNRKHFRDTIAGKFEERLIERIGQERVDWLKGPHCPKQYRDDDYRRIARIFRRRTRLYRKLRGMG